MRTRRGRAALGALVAALAGALSGGACGRGEQSAASPAAPTAGGGDEGLRPSDATSRDSGGGEAIPGRWRKLRPERLDPALSPEQRELVAQLEAIGYASGSTPAPAASGVTVHDRARAWEGLNFYTSGHAPEAVLMDMDGRVLHRWHYAFLDAFPDFPPAWLHQGAEFWRRAHLYENGDVLAIFEGLGLVKIDARSQLLWASPLRAHHDLEVLPNGDILVLTRRAHMLPRLDPDKPILEDYVSVLDASGREKRSVSVLEALERSKFAALWQPDGHWYLGDVLHTNSLAVLDGSLDGRVPGFQRGHLLISMLVPDLIAVLDLESSNIVWALAGEFRRQHDPRQLANGHLLLFDNRGAAPYSRVLEIDPARDDAVVWSYGGSDQHPFFSSTCGAAERLPNGNTLISESDGGRAFEVTPAGETVWEFVNPARAGEGLIATLFEVERLPPGFPSQWP